jgi:hypothetical protein
MTTRRVTSKFLHILPLLFSFTGHVDAFEVGTHAAITQAAFQKSVLADSEFLQQLGLTDDANPFGETYLDVSGTNIASRYANAYELKYMKGAQPLSISGWLMRGAIREDDLGAVLSNPIGDDPHDDPYGSIFRVFNHFYDPIFNRALTTYAGVLGQKAPDWALGSSDVFNQPNNPDPNRRNHFSLFDARESMYRALTGRDSQGNVIASTELVRNQYWATTFRSLGDVVHLLQDMGQPQHTRNDPHSGQPTFGHESTFEYYLESRALKQPSYQIDGTTIEPQPLNYDGYPIPSFTKYSAFWSTRQGLSGTGLADYSNQGFFTFGTNLGQNIYQSPSNNRNDYVPESTVGMLPFSPILKINFLRGNVIDYNSILSSPNIRITTESMFDSFLGPTDSNPGQDPTYSLNRFNYDDMAAQLIPRAVSYSAGLINYFFRGKIDFVPDPDNPGKYNIKNLGPEDMTGTFALYYDDKDGYRTKVNDGEWKNVTILANPLGLATINNKSDQLTFTPPTDPPPKVPGEYMLVFNGDMGQEKAGDGSVGAVVAKKIGANVGALIISRYVSNGRVGMNGSNDLGKTWSAMGSIAGYGQLTFVGDNTLLSDSALSTDGGKNWEVLSQDALSKTYRLQSAPSGDGRLIGLSADGDSNLPITKAYSVDKGRTWTAAGIASGLTFTTRQPTYIGSNELVVKSSVYEGQTPCSFDPNLICKNYSDAIFHSPDNGGTWNLVVKNNQLGNHLLYIGKNKWVKGVLTPDSNGLPTLFTMRTSGLVPNRKIEFVVSTDLGATWTAVGYPAGMNYVAPDWPDPWYWVYAGNRTIFAYFHNESWPPWDYMSISKDNGATWSAAGNLPAGTAYYGLYGMAFVGSNTAILGLPAK